MAHYAFLNENNIVVDVIVGKDENDLAAGVSSWEDYYSARRNQRCVRTSYNTVGGVHSEDGTAFRKNYAGIGFTYDEERDAFIPAQPFESWVLNEDTCLWDAPVPYPADGAIYAWDEESGAWVEVEDDTL
jgi:hypothetical protein